jgi:uncharacterized protein (DUF58 family)
MTARLRLLSALIYGLIFAALVLRRGELILLALPLIIYLAAGFLTDAEAPRLEARRALSVEWARTNAPVQMTLTLTNLGSRPAQVLIEDALPPAITLLEGNARILTRISPGERATLAYTLSARRGRYGFDAVQVSSRDPLGLLVKRQTLSAPAQLLVLPEFSRLHSVPLRPRRTHGFTGPIPARRAGNGVSFFGVRHYQLGDPMRRINWKITTRHDQEIFANEFEQERITDVGLILDARQQCNVRAGEDSLFEYSVQAAASLADVFIGEGHRVGLLVYGRTREITYPGYGKRQRQRILRALARAQTGDNIALETLSYLPTRFFPARSQIVLVSSLLADDLPILSRLRACGYHLLVISPDPVHFEARSYSASTGPEVAWASRLANLERVLLLRKMGRMGIHTIDWQVDTSLDRILWAALGKAPSIVLG